MKSILDDLRPKLWHKFDVTASWIRNLFHPDRRWMENSIATFWGDWGIISGAYVQTSGATTPWPGIMAMLWLTRCSLYSSLWLLQIRVIPHPPYSPDLAPVIFSYSKNEIENQGAMFWQHWRDPDRIAERDEDAEVKWLSEVLPILEVPLESLYQCQRGLLQRGWGRIEISVGG